MSNPPRAHNRIPRVNRPGAIHPDAGNGPTVAESFMTARITLGKVFRADSPNFFWLLGITIVLVIIGLLMVLSASSVDSFLQDGQFFGAFGRQAAYAAIGLPVMMVLSQLPLVFWRKWALLFLAIGCFLQLLVLNQKI